MRVDVPTFGELVIGYRGWAVDDWVLRPVSGGSPWRPGVNVARCIPRDTWGWWPYPCPRAPGPCGACGIYGLHDVESLRTGYAACARAWGVFAAWGDLEVHAEGFRAEKAQILAIAAPADLATVAGFYGVPLAPADLATVAGFYGVPLLEAEELQDYGGRFGQPLPEAVRPERVVAADAARGLWQQWQAAALGQTRHPSAPTVPAPRRSALVVPKCGDVLAAIDPGGGDDDLSVIVPVLWPRQVRGP